MLQGGARCHFRVDAVLYGAGVGKKHAGVHPQRHQTRTHPHRVARHIAKVLGARHQAHGRNVRPAGTQQKQAQRQRHPDDQAALHAEHQSGKKGGAQSAEIQLGKTPGGAEDGQIDQGQHSHNDGGRQRGLRQVVQGRCEEERGQRDAHRRVDPGCRADCAGIEIHHRAGEAAGHRKAAGERGGQITGPQRHQFLIGLDTLAALGRQGLPHRDRLHKTHHADQRSRHQQLTPQRQIPQRQGQRRQATGHGADQLHTLALPIEQPGQQRTQGNRRHRTGFGPCTG